MAYVLFEDYSLDLDFVFPDEQLMVFKELWNEGVSVQEISKKMHRHPTEIILLIIDHAERDLIQNRETGVYGL